MAAPHPAYTLAPAVAQHLRTLVQNLAKKNAKAVLADAQQLVETHGPDAHLAFVRALLLSAEQNKQQEYRWQVLAQELSVSSRRVRYFVSLVCRAFAGAESIHQNGAFRFVFEILQLQPPAALAVLTALSQSSDPLVARGSLAALKRALASGPQSMITASNLQGMSEDMLHLLLFLCSTRESLVEEVARLRAALRAANMVTPILAPLVGAPATAPSSLLLTWDSEDSISLSGILQDLGYAAMQSHADLRNVFSASGRPITPPEIARVLGMMARTHSGLDNQHTPGLVTQFPPAHPRASSDLKSWNIQVFCDVILELAPQLDWDAVNANFDHPGFVLPDPPALTLIASVFRRCCPAPEGTGAIKLGPVLAPWRNTAGQLSFLRLAVAAPPGFFNWSSDSLRAVEVQGVPLPPPVSDQQRAAQALWRSLSLLETLLRLSEVESYSIVRGILEHPLKQCSELLVLALTQAQVAVGQARENLQRVPASAWNVMTAELFRMAIPRVIGLDVPPTACSHALAQRLWGRAPVHLVRAFVEAIALRNAVPSLTPRPIEPTCMPRIIAIVEDDLESLQRQQSSPTSAAILVLSLTMNQLGAAGMPLVVELIVSAVARNLAWAAESHRWLRDVFLGHPTSSQAQRSDEQRQLHFHQAAAAARATLRLIDLKLSGMGSDAAREQTMLQHLAPVFAALHAASVAPETALPAQIVDAVKVLMGRFQAAMQRRQRDVQQGPPPAQPPQPLPQQPSRAAEASFAAPPGQQPQLTPAMVKLNQALGANHSGDGTLADPTAGISTQRNFSQEVEATANAYFERIYSGEISTEAVLQLLQRFKTSSVEREQDIFACMIHNLFDEYRFFPNYPDRQLRLTAILFGSLVQKSLVSFLPLGLVLRCILDALRKPPPSKMFAFGVTALQQFLPRLAEWPQYCSHILAIRHMAQVPEIVRFIESVHGQQGASQNINRPTQPSAGPPGVSTRPVSGGPPHIQNAGAAIVPSVVSAPTTTIAGRQVENAPPGLGGARRSASETAEAKPEPQVVAIAKLPEDESDKIHFIFNNVSDANIRAKAPELLAVVAGRESHLRYVAHYLVSKRVASESNFHKVYVGFLEETFGVLAERMERKRRDTGGGPPLKEKPLNTMRRLIVEQTLVSVKDLLSRESVRTQVSERSLLKNLGTWLGLWTIGKDKPLLHKHLAPRDMIVDAFKNGRLVVVVPFVCKVLETVKESKTFMPPNPWTMSILRILGDVYRTPRLRLNLKFEVEVLCKSLGTTPDELKTTSIFTSRGIIPIDDSPDFTPAPKAQNGAVAAVVGPLRGAAEAFSASGLGATIAPPGVHRPGTEPATPEQVPARLEADGETLASLLQISPHIGLFAQQPQLQKYVIAAAERAIREIIGPVVERSVTIACITTKELVLKDFATEPDVKQLRAAANVMVQNLAGSLALVTCKEPLRVSMTNQLRSILQQHTPEQFQGLIEPAIHAVAADNLDIACNFIEKAATEKATHETNEALSAAELQRERFLEAHPERASAPRPTGLEPPATADQQKAMFCDPAVFASRGGRWLAAMPEQLRPHLGGLLPSQIAVYEDFSRIPFLQQQLQAGSSAISGPPGSELLGRAGEKLSGAGSGGSEGSVGSDASGRGAIAQAPAPPLRALAILPAVGQFMQILSQIASEAASAPPLLQRASLAQLPPDHAVQTLVRHAAMLARQVSPAPGAVDIVASGHHPFPAFPMVSAAAMARLALSRLCDAVQLQMMQPQQAEALPVVSALARDALLVVLESIVSVNRSHLSNELASWLLYIDSQQQLKHALGSTPLARSRLVFHRALIPVLLRRGIISAKKFDTFLASQIGLGPAAEFAAFMLSEFVTKTRTPVLSATGHLLLTTQSLRRWAASHGNEDLVREVEAAVAVSQQYPDPIARPRDDSAAFSMAADPEDSRAAIQRVFDSWIMAYSSWQASLQAAALVGAPTPFGPRPEGEAAQTPVGRQKLAALAAEARVRDLLTDIFKQQEPLEASNRFFRVSCELAVERYLACRAAMSAQHAVQGARLAHRLQHPAARRELQQEFMQAQEEASYLAIDAFSALVSLICKEQPSPSARIAFYSRMCSLVVRLLISDYDSSEARFQQRPYFRFFSNWMADLFGDGGNGDGQGNFSKGKKKKWSKKQQRQEAKKLEQVARDASSTLFGLHTNPIDPYSQSQILVAFSTALITVSPSRLPGFSFAWLELVSNRFFVPRLLMGVPGLTQEGVDKHAAGREEPSVLALEERGWPLFQRLLVEQFRFLTPAMVNSQPGRVLLDGTVRLALMLLHDFPEFLADFHFSFMDAVQPNCVQLRNIILSAYPTSIGKLPDIHGVGLERLPELRTDPRILPNVANALATADPSAQAGQPSRLKSEVEQFLSRRGSATFLSSLASRLGVSSETLPSAGRRTNVPLLNALVLFVGMQVLSHRADDQDTRRLGMQIYETLARDLDVNGRYFLINAITNQLRFPNTHTHYFSGVLLSLFSKASPPSAQSVSFQEQIVRVLTERMIAHRPHPWGLLVTVAELLKNHRYQFWTLDFVRAAPPEIERLLHSISRCLGINEA